MTLCTIFLGNSFVAPVPVLGFLPIVMFIPTNDLRLLAPHRRGRNVCAIPVISLVVMGGTSPKWADDTPKDY
jgi:hypothetical protein